MIPVALSRPASLIIIQNTQLIPIKIRPDSNRLNYSSAMQIYMNPFLLPHSSTIPTVNRHQVRQSATSAVALGGPLTIP